ncbi:MAG: transcriptional regulator [Promethearchaeota archaeon]
MDSQKHTKDQSDQSDQSDLNGEEHGANMTPQKHPVEDLDELSSFPLLSMHELLKVPLRFNIMFLLYNYERLGFTRMQKVLNTTPGNLDHHLKKLKEAGWISDSVFFSPRPLKIFQITPFGAGEFDIQIAQFKRVVRKL